VTTSDDGPRLAIEPLGDNGWLARLAGDPAPHRLRALAAALERRWPGAFEDLIPTWNTLGILGRDLDNASHLDQALAALSLPEAPAAPPRLVEIPTRYGGQCGRDLDDLARRLGLSSEEVVRLHSAPTYEVAFLGFLPGFPYLEGLDPRLQAPRRATPRPRVPAGSVGIAGAATGIYPLESPGGWHLIGRSALPLFDPHREPAALLQAGDRVRFVPVDADTSEPPPPRATALPSSPVFEVVAAGLATSIQDLGRPGCGAIGLGPGGALDPDAHLLANWLVGNPSDAATLELDTVGPTLRCLQPLEIALVGAPFELRVDGRVVDTHRPHPVPAGALIETGRPTWGRRAYLAITGGFDAPLELGSRSWHSLARLGLRVERGQTLGRANDEQAPTPMPQSAWSLRHRPRPSAELRLVLAPGADPAILAQRWRVSTRADRMALVLEPATTALRPAAADRLTEPVTFGTVQRLPDGCLAILLADRQTTGGYPRLGEIAAADRASLAQLRPGDHVSLRAVAIATARAMRSEQISALAALRLAIAARRPVPVPQRGTMG
jgi:KipI family sensor histidine kinase inhibitor